jgi:hypothetical protein
MQILAALVVLAAIVISPPVAPSLGSSAAGEYVRSDGFMHERLTLAAPGSFVYVELGCVGGPTTHQGKATLTADRVSIEGRHGVLEPELVPVAWGQRHYLVAPGEMKRFCSYVSGKTMDEPIPFFLRAEDQSKPAPSAQERPIQCR